MLALAVGLNLAMVPQAFAGPPPGAPVVPDPAPVEVEDSDGDGSPDQPDLASAAIAAHQLDEAVEDLSQRAESTRVVANPDGSITEQLFGAPMWVQDEDGEWVDVDYTLVPRDGGGFVPKAAPTDLVIDGGGKEFARLKLPDGTVTVWSWPHTLPNPTVDGPVATYAVGDGVDLLVTATARGVSTRIQVNTPTAVIPAFRVKVRTYGAELKQGDAGGMLLADDEGGDPSASIAVLSAWDARRDGFGDPVKVVRVEATLTETAAVGDRVDQELALTVPAELVDDPEVVYPLTIDPDLSPFAPEQDAWAREGVGWVSDLHYRLLVGASKEHVNSNMAVSLVQWDDGRIRNRNISNAEVGFFQYMSASCSSKRMNIHQVLGSWSESTLTWANKPGVSTAAATSSYLTKNIGASGCTPAGGFVTADVTGMVQSWADGALDVGMQLSVPDANKNDFSFERRLCSTNYEASHTTCNKAARTPYLKFTYTNRAPYAPVAPPVLGSWWYNGRLWTTSTSPVFTTQPIGVWGSTMQVTYEVWVENSSTLAATCTTGAVASWGVAQCAVPYLAPGAPSYVVRAKATDNSGLVSAWSGWTAFSVIDSAGPNPPADLAFSDVSAVAITNSLTPTISARVALPSGQACVTANCLSAQFTITKPGGATTTLAGSQVASGGYSTVVVPAGTLADLSTYKIQAYTASADVGQVSGLSSILSMTTRLDTAPGTASNLTIQNAAGDPISTNPAAAMAGDSLKFRARMPAGELCPGQTSDCLVAEFAAIDSAGVVRWGPAFLTGRPGQDLTTDVVDTTGWHGNYNLSVRVRKSWTSAWSTAIKSLVVEVAPEAPTIPPEAPTITVLDSPAPGTAKFRISLAPVPSGGYTYQWTLQYTSPSHPTAVVLTGEVPGAAERDVTVPLSLPSDELATVKVSVKAVLAPPNQSVVSPTTETSEFLVAG